MNFRIYYQDTNAGGIVYHSKYLDFAERARSELLVDMGLSNTQMVESGVGIVIRHAAIDYRKPARLDEVIAVETSVDSVENVRMNMTQTFVRADETLVVLKLQLAFIDPKTLRPVRVLPEMKERFLKYNQEKEG